MDAAAEACVFREWRALMIRTFRLCIEATLKKLGVETEDGVTIKERQSNE